MCGSCNFLPDRFDYCNTNGPSWTPLSHFVQASISQLFWYFGAQQNVPLSLWLFSIWFNILTQNCGLRFDPPSGAIAFEERNAYYVSSCRYGYIRFCISITYRGWHRMASISQTTFSNAFSSMNIAVIVLIRISLKFVSTSLINSNLAFVQIMAWAPRKWRLYLDQWLPGILTRRCITRPQRVNASEAKPDVYQHAQASLPYQDNTRSMKLYLLVNSVTCKMLES